MTSTEMRLSLKAGTYELTTLLLIAINYSWAMFLGLFLTMFLFNLLISVLVSKMEQEK